MVDDGQMWSLMEKSMQGSQSGSVPLSGSTPVRLLQGILYVDRMLTRSFILQTGEGCVFMHHPSTYHSDAPPFL